MQDTLNTVSAGPSNTVRRVEEGELLEVLDGPQEAHEKNRCLVTSLAILGGSEWEKRVPSGKPLN